MRMKRAMVLAAGLGRRMRPITATLPKPLVQVGGKALVDHALDRLADAGIEVAVVNVHYLADRLETHLAARRRPRIVISDERRQLLDTGGGVVKALPTLGPGPFVLVNSDSFWIDGARDNLAALIAGWDGDRMDALLLLAPAASSSGYDGPGDFFMDNSGRLTPRQDGGTAPLVYTGVAIVDPRATFAAAPAGPFPLDVLIGRICAKGRLFGVLLDGTWFHVGTPAAIDAVERALVSSAA